MTQVRFILVNWSVCSFDHISGASNAMIVVGGSFEAC